MSETYRDYCAWEEAIVLSQKVHELIEALPADERSALAASLNSAAVNIPTTVALNLVQQQPANIRDVVSLQTQIELVDRIYPALDTGEVAKAANELLTRLQNPTTFRQIIPQPEQVESPVESTDEPVEGEPSRDVSAANRIDLQSS